MGLAYEGGYYGHLVENALQTLEEKREELYYRQGKSLAVPLLPLKHR